MSSRKFRITYFNMRGRAEIIRMVLSAADKDFEDVRLSREEWEKLKPSSPTGVLPIVETPEGERLVQTMATARYLARSFDLMGHSDKEQYLIDRAIDQASDFVEGMVVPMFGPEDAKERLCSEFMEKSGKRLLEGASKFLKESGGPFFAGQRLTLADIWWNCVLFYMRQSFMKHVQPFKENMAHYELVLKTNAGLARWEKQRPVTPL